MSARGWVNERTCWGGYLCEFAVHSELVQRGSVSSMVRCDPVVKEANDTRPVCQHSERSFGVSPNVPPLGKWFRLSKPSCSSLNVSLLPSPLVGCSHVDQGRLSNLPCRLTGRKTRNRRAVSARDQLCMNIYRFNNKHGFVFPTEVKSRSWNGCRCVDEIRTSMAAKSDRQFTHPDQKPERRIQ